MEFLPEVLLTLMLVRGFLAALVFLHGPLLACCSFLSTASLVGLTRLCVGRRLVAALRPLGSLGAGVSLVLVLVLLKVFTSGITNNIHDFVNNG